MEWYQYLLGLILIFMFERLREITKFGEWFKASYFSKVESSKFLAKYFSAETLHKIYYGLKVEQLIKLNT